MKAKEFIPASKPRNPVVRQQQTSGAGAHRDKKKEQKQGYEKHKGKGVSEGYGTKEFEVDGYTYMTDLDREEDNQKIWHMIKTPDGKTINVDFTPYAYMTKDDVEFYIKLGMPKRQGRGPLDSEQLQKMAQIKGVAMLDPKMARAGMDEGRRDPEDWDEGNTEPPNNFAVYINGKKWKVFQGRGTYADDYREKAHYQQLKDWARKKSEATGKKWEVYITGEKATEDIDEGWKEKLAAAGLAGAMAFGAAGPAQARVSPDGEGGFTPSAAQMIKVSDKADQAKEVVPLSKRYDSRYEGSPESGVIKVDGKLYKFAGRTAEAPGKGEKIKVPAGAVGIRGLGAVTIELVDDKYYQTNPD